METDQLALAEEDHTTSKPVEVLGWVAASATALVGVLVLIDGIPPVVITVVAGVGVVATKLLSYATTKKVTPWKAVVSKITPDGRIVAGPAATLDTGTEVEQPLAA
jgi:hypothetical protein